MHSFPAAFLDAWQHLPFHACRTHVRQYVGYWSTHRQERQMALEWLPLVSPRPSTRLSSPPQACPTLDAGSRFKPPDLRPLPAGRRPLASLQPLGRGDIPIGFLRPALVGQRAHPPEASRLRSRFSELIDCTANSLAKGHRLRRGSLASGCLLGSTPRVDWRGEGR